MGKFSLRRLRATMDRVDELAAYGGAHGPPQQPPPIDGLQRVRVTSLTKGGPGSNYYPCTHFTPVFGAGYPAYTVDSGAGWLLMSLGGLPHLEQDFWTKLAGVNASDGKLIFWALTPGRQFIEGFLDGALSYNGSATLSVTYWTGSIEAVSVTAGGSGYTGAPSVSFSGGGGSGAAATATLTGDAVTSVTVTDPGSGYTTPPTVTFTGDGTGAAAEASVEADSGENVTVYDRFLISGQSVSAGKRVGASLEARGGRYYATVGQCESA